MCMLKTKMYDLWFKNRSFYPYSPHFKPLTYTNYLFSYLNYRLPFSHSHYPQKKLIFVSIS